MYVNGNAAIDPMELCPGDVIEVKANSHHIQTLIKGFRECRSEACMSIACKQAVQAFQDIMAAGISGGSVSAYQVRGK